MLSIKNFTLPILILCFFSLPVNFIQAQDSESQFILCGQEGDDCTLEEVKELINVAIDFLMFTIAVPLAVIGIMIAGIMYALYPANSNLKSKANDILTGIVIGFIMVLSAYLVVKLIIVGLSAEDSILRNLFNQ